MIIRCQDKNGIANFDNIDSITLHENNEIYAYNGCLESKLLLGKYSTEAKAIKVLDMIEDAYCRMEDIKCGAVQSQKYDSFNFQMPKDSEV